VLSVTKEIIPVKKGISFKEFAISIDSFFLLNPPSVKLIASKLIYGKVKGSGSVASKINLNNILLGFIGVMGGLTGGTMGVIGVTGGLTGGTMGVIGVTGGLTGGITSVVPPAVGLISGIFKTLIEWFFPSFIPLTVAITSVVIASPFCICTMKYRADFFKNKQHKSKLELTIKKIKPSVAVV
jgi:hypothetical protein